MPLTEAITQIQLEHLRELIMQRISTGQLRPTRHPPFKDQPYVGFAILLLDPDEDDRYFVGQDGTFVLCDWHPSHVVPVRLTIEEVLAHRTHTWCEGMEVLLGRRHPMLGHIQLLVG